MSVSERVRQFREATARPGAEDIALAERLLAGPLLGLFLEQHPRDVVHGAATARWLLARGYEDAELLQAALVHDVGKGWQRRRDRVAYVVTDALGVAPRLGKRGSRLALRRAVARSLEHSERGARLVEEAGAAARVVELTRCHHAPPGDDDMLAVLQAADAAS